MMGVPVLEPPKDQLIADRALMAALTQAAAAAGAATLAKDRSAFAVRAKADHSPVTDADERAQAVLLKAVSRLLPGVAVVSEELADRPTDLGDIFVCIDPLDGTKEFIAGSNEYTVNLAILRNRTPVAGIIAVPACGLVFRGVVGGGAERLEMRPDGAVAPEDQTTPIRCRAAPPGAPVAAVSRSHLDPSTLALLDRLGVATRAPCGSALKFCRVAEGSVDIYPRLAPTCEWDVAAGHALIAAAGGTLTTPDGGDLRYGRSDVDFRIPAFIAWGDRDGTLRARL
jgi:3'(2'), 5'-bisphosphate nucleotidase